jgi:predicted nucleotidyltransferase
VATLQRATQPKKPGIQELKTKLPPVLRRYDIIRAAMFGSVARGEAAPESDLDLLVEYAPDTVPSLRELVALHEELATLAGRKVEIVEYHLLRSRVRKRVMQDQVPVM